MRGEREIYLAKNNLDFSCSEMHINFCRLIIYRVFLVFNINALSETSTYIPLGFLMKYLYNS